MLAPRIDETRQLVVAIQPDGAGPENSSSPRWARFITEAGHVVREVNVFRPDILEQLRGADGFMWRHHHHPSQRQIARRLLPVVEQELGLAVYPNQKTGWHFDDKIAQHYLFAARGIPAPRTWVWFDRRLALEGVREIDYPVVLKLRSGAGSSNVRLVRSRAEAERWIGRLFGRGIRSCDDVDHRTRSVLRRTRTKLRPFFRRGPVHQQYMSVNYWAIHKDYVLFQEFLPGNAFDTRVTVIGDRAFAYRRHNRTGDFRASGSGRLDTDQSRIAPEFIALAFDVARTLETQSCAIDGLWRGREPVVSEVSYTYVSSFVRACPGHWTSAMQWMEEPMWPEIAQATDFLDHLLAQEAGRRVERSTVSRSA